MTREDIIRTARGVGWIDYDLAEARDMRLVMFAERFAELVRAEEREACLQIADQCADADMHASMAANAIRARGQA